MEIKKISEVINLHKNIVGSAGSVNTKFLYAFKDKNFKLYKKLIDDYVTEPLQDKRLELAIVDSNGAVIEKEGKFQYTKEGVTELKNFTEILLSKNVDFDFYQVDFNSLSDNEISTFYDKETKAYAVDVSADVYEQLKLLIKNLPEYETIE